MTKCMMCQKTIPDRLVCQPCVQAELATLHDENETLGEVLDELLEVADLRGDADLPHPADDPKLWTARMQTAWDEARALQGVRGP